MSPPSEQGRARLVRAAIVALASVMWFAPPPEGLTLQAWRLFAIFAATIVVGGRQRGADSDGVGDLGGDRGAHRHPRARRRRTRVSRTARFSSSSWRFSSRAPSSNAGSAPGSGHVVVSLFGRSTLGLSYSIFLVDGLIAPAFPSNTARSGVLYPLAFSLASASGATAADGSRRRVGAFLMFSGIVSLSLSSTLWLTAMAANPLGTEIARTFGVEIGFGSWLVAACVPTLTAMLADAAAASLR